MNIKQKAIEIKKIDNIINKSEDKAMEYVIQIDLQNNLSEKDFSDLLKNTMQKELSNTFNQLKNEYKNNEWLLGAIGYREFKKCN